MNLDISKIEFSRNDLRRGIKIPKALSEELAEDVGFHIGDGYMKSRKNEKGVEIKYDFVYAGHINDDLEYFKSILIPRKKSLFNFNEMKIDSIIATNSIRIRPRSKAVFYFFRDVLDVKESPKDTIKVPKWILENKKFQVAFLRGIMDSDGCFTVKRKNYPTISINGKSEKLIKSIGKMLNNFGINHCLYEVNPYEKRTSKYYKKYCIDISGSNAIKWVNTIGFNNPKHIRKYNKWAETDSNHRFPAVSSSKIF